jgi:hypothetical protein
VPTNRGFVQKIEVGRAGLVRISLILVDGSQEDYVIADLDADPERFNERLSKLAVLRDAMDRAELVELEFSTGEAGRIIDRAVRISRDALVPPKQLQDVSGFVVLVTVQSINAAVGATETPDSAQVSILDLSLQLRHFTLNLQAPERAVAIALLQILRDSQAAGRIVTLRLDTTTQPRPTVVNVASGAGSGTGLDFSRALELDGFVESLALLQYPGASAALSSLAIVRFTTAPPFNGPGNTLPLTPFAPAEVQLLVPQPSATYDLFEAGLRDNLRMRVAAIETEPAKDDNVEPATGEMRTKGGDSAGAVAANRADAPAAPYRLSAFVRVSAPAATTGPSAQQNTALVLGAELLAPLASASRPVWIHISRESLDRGPEILSCTPGTPTSDLSPQTLRDLRIPYAAVWKGMGCFNEGVYRFEIQVGTCFVLRVDGHVACSFDAPDKLTKLAYACLGGHHDVTVELEAWTCDKVLTMDVYRVR